MDGIIILVCVRLKSRYLEIVIYKVRVRYVGMKRKSVVGGEGGSFKI